MTENRFEEVIDIFLNGIRETLVVKGKEYRRNNNPFHNFDIGSQRSGLIREKVLDGFLLKHEISIADITNDLVENKLPTIAVLNEKFGDNVIYLILKMASIIDKIEVYSEEEKHQEYWSGNKFLEVDKDNG
jgi:hypothetical protein